MSVSPKTTQVLLAVIATVLVVWALKATHAVTMPLAFAFFIAVLVHPLQRSLNRRLPRWLTLIAILLLLAAVAGVAIAALELSVDLIEPKLPQYSDRLQQMLTTAIDLARQYGLPISDNPLQAQGSSGQLAGRAIGGIQSILSALSVLVLVVSLLALLLLEVDAYRQKVRRGFPDAASQKIINAMASISRKLRRYLWVMTFTSLLTGILTGVWCLLLGVDLAFVWGLIAFVLNFVPTLGSIIAVIPPTLVAFIFGGAAQGLITLIGLATLQVILGNFVDPKLQGNSLQLSPFVALISIVFWGWVWGIAGAILGVPMTVALVVLCGEFQPTRGIAVLLGEQGTDYTPS
ncbi:AI-2E family transporter [Almyronema epifaneia]|uniref:AI-2E family transporter n=1 Tax=Almyronema epifaneia S1 TaxID=2991925 RepID=A0ABW6IC72_9CYAN